VCYSSRRPASPPQEILLGCAPLFFQHFLCFGSRADFRSRQPVPRALKVRGGLARHPIQTYQYGSRGNVAKQLILAGQDGTGTQVESAAECCDGHVENTLGACKNITSLIAPSLTSFKVASSRSRIEIH